MVITSARTILSAGKRFVNNTACRAKVGWKNDFIPSVVFVRNPIINSNLNQAVINPKSQRAKLAFEFQEEKVDHSNNKTGNTKDEISRDTNIKAPHLLDHEDLKDIRRKPNQSLFLVVRPPINPYPTTFTSDYSFPLINEINVSVRKSIEIFVNEMFQGTAKAKLAANLARAFYIHKSAEKVSDEDELDANHFYFYVACLEKFDDNCKVNPDIAEDHQWLTKEEVAHDIKPISVVKALQPTILNAKWN